MIILRVRAVHLDVRTCIGNNTLTYVDQKTPQTRARHGVELHNTHLPGGYLRLLMHVRGKD